MMLRGERAQVCTVFLAFENGKQSSQVQYFYKFCICVMEKKPYPSKVRPPRYKGHYISKTKLNHVKSILKNRLFSSKSGEPKRATNTLRRIVELDYLSSQLLCKHCDTLLDFNNLVKETFQGLASVMHIECQNNVCKQINIIHTCRKSKSHPDCYTVNLKCSIGKFVFLHS